MRLEHDGVGANFHDHPYAILGFNTSNMSTPNPNSLTTDPAFNASSWAQYLANKTGPLTQARGNSLAFIPLPLVDPTNYRSLVSQLLRHNTSAYLLSNEASTSTFNPGDHYLGDVSRSLDDAYQAGGRCTLCTRLLPPSSQPQYTHIAR